MRLLAVGEWDVCGDKFYSKHQIYAMQWPDIKLEHMRCVCTSARHTLRCCLRDVTANSGIDCRVACAPYGGPIALVRDDRKIVLVTGGSTKPVVTTHTAAGVKLGAFTWEKGRIMGMGWTSEEDLMLLEQSGEVCAACSLSLRTQPPLPRLTTLVRRCTCTRCTGRRRRAGSHWARRWRERA